MDKYQGHTPKEYDLIIKALERGFERKFRDFNNVWTRGEMNMGVCTQPMYQFKDESGDEYHTDDTCNCYGIPQTPLHSIPVVTEEMELDWLMNDETPYMEHRVYNQHSDWAAARRQKVREIRLELERKNDELYSKLHERAVFSDVEPGAESEFPRLSRPDGSLWTFACEP